MKITKEIRGWKYTYDNELYVLVKRTKNQIPQLAPNFYSHNSNEERFLEFAGSFQSCKHQIMHIAAFVFQGLYMDEPIPGEDWYQGTGIYSQEEQGSRLKYSIYLDYFEQGIDKYNIILVENEVGLMFELGIEKEFFIALMELGQDIEIVDGNGNRVLGYSQKLELQCKEYEAGNAEKECQANIFSELWKKRLKVNEPVQMDYVWN